MFIYKLLTSGIDAVDIVLLVVAFSLAAIFGIVMHEIGHGYVALWNGDETAKMNGRLSLNPGSHLSVPGFLMLLFVGFGWAKPVPINPENFKDYKKGMISVSLAGVTVNLIIASTSALLLFLFYMAYLHVSTEGSAMAENSLKFFIYLFRLSLQINFMLALFNILPIYPLDGYNLVSALIGRPSKFQDFMIRYGSFILIGLIIFSNLMRVLGIWYLDIFGMFGGLLDKLDKKIMLEAFKATYG